MNIYIDITTCKEYSLIRTFLKIVNCVKNYIQRKTFYILKSYTEFKMVGF